MDIIDLLANDNYIIANKTIARLYGLEEAVMLGELASEYKYWKRRDELKDGFFFSTIENVKDNTTLSDKRQRAALTTLKNAGIITVKLMGIPAKRYIKIEVDQIFRLLISKDGDLGKTSFAEMEKLDTTETAKLDITNEQTNNNNLNNNKNSNNKEIEEKRKRFVPPTLDEVKAYCVERNNNVDAQRFIDYYTSNGWLVGKNKMKDWKAAVRTWERNGYSNKGSQNSSFETNEFYEAAIQASERQYAQLAQNPKRAAVDRGVIDRMDEKAKNPPKTAENDAGIRERMERLKKELGGKNGD